MQMRLPVAQDIQSARVAAASMKIAGEDHHFFATCALEIIAQGILTLSVRHGAEWSATDLVDQIRKPREEFEPSGLVDGSADRVVFNVDERQRASVIGTALSIVDRHFGSEPGIAA